MRALALDVGSKTIGLALSDAEQIIATACETLHRRGHAADALAVENFVRDREVGHVVIGLPLELDGREGRRARAVREFMSALCGRFDQAGMTVEVLTWDERFSTAAAERTLLEADVSRARRKQHIDAMAAQFILQGWLDSRGGATP
jgi:putative Holliday junction resolvase